MVNGIERQFGAKGLHAFSYTQALLGQNCKGMFRKINCLVSHKMNIWRPLPVLQPIGLLERVRDKLGYQIYSKE
jgi:hypothetical protein